MVSTGWIENLSLQFNRHRRIDELLQSGLVATLYLSRTFVGHESDFAAGAGLLPR